MHEEKQPEVRPISDSELRVLGLTRPKLDYGKVEDYEKTLAASELPEQPTFTLLAQDRTSPSIIAEWIRANIYTAPREKLLSALETAMDMRDFDTKKMPD